MGEVVGGDEAVQDDAAREESTQQSAQELAAAFVQLSEWAHRAAGQGQGAQVRHDLQDRLGAAAHESVVTRRLPALEHVNVQTALDAWLAAPGRASQIRGVFVPPHFGTTSLMTLITGDGPPTRWCAPQVVDLPNGPSSTLACHKRVVIFVTDERGDYAVYAGNEEQEGFLLEVAGLPVDQAQQVLAELDDLRERLDVYRGHLISVRPTDFGGITLDFLAQQPLPREQVILPEAVLTHVERHALDVAQHRDALLAAGQHLKRGVLLYGPPGTGKTHTIRYLTGRLTGYTRLLLQGVALHAIGPAAALARRLAPSVVVLEDIDLVAQDRGYGPGENPILFELLDAMDGSAADSDILFLLTTNRVQVLERALAARPGRVDVAVEIARPDAAGRAALLRLYAAGAPLTLTDEVVHEVVERTDGVTASFVKELVRRAVLEALRAGEPLHEVSADQLRRALDDLLHDTQSVTRRLLGGVSADGDDPADPAELDDIPEDDGFVAMPPSGAVYRPGGALSSSLSLTFDEPS